jgi:hypothetical protein
MGEIGKAKDLSAPLYNPGQGSMTTFYDDGYEFSCPIKTERFFRITVHCAASKFTVKEQLFHLEDGGCMFHCNISNDLPDYATSYPRRQ